MDKRELLDDDGENRAVRTFLQLYGGANNPTVAGMKSHLKNSGFDGCWPEWVSSLSGGGHLTTGGAQDWLRYLFGLERDAQQEKDAARWVEIGKAVERACRDLPEGYDIHIELERGAGTVRLYLADTDADMSDFENDTFAEKIHAAIDATLSISTSTSADPAGQLSGGKE